jgi:hypothetical protein
LLAPTHGRAKRRSLFFDLYPPTARWAAFWQKLYQRLAHGSRLLGAFDSIDCPSSFTDLSGLQLRLYLGNRATVLNHKVSGRCLGASRGERRNIHALRLVVIAT